MTLTLQQAKDEVAKNNGWENWKTMTEDMSHHNRSMLFEQAAEIYAEAKAKEFAEWLHENRWYSFTGGKWNYTFENGTSISDATYEKNYRKTTEQLYETFKQSTENCLHEFKLDGNSEIPFDLFCKNCGKKA